MSLLWLILKVAAVITSAIAAWKHEWEPAILFLLWVFLLDLMERNTKRK